MPKTLFDLYLFSLFNFLCKFASISYEVANLCMNIHGSVDANLSELGKCFGFYLDFDPGSDDEVGGFMKIEKEITILPGSFFV